MEQKIPMTEDNLKERLIIVCPNKDCGQKLGIPKTTKTLQVTCPKCRTSFVYPAQTPRRKTTSWFLNKVKAHPIFLGLIATIWFFLIVNKHSTGTLTLNNSLSITTLCIAMWFIGTWIMDKLKEEGTKWYYQKWFVFLMLFILTPIGITLLWAGSRFKKPTKIGLTIAFGLWFVLGVLTRSSERFYYSPKDEIARLFDTHKENIFLESASRYAKISFRNEILSRKVSTATTTFTTPRIAKKWGGSIVLVKSMDKNGNELGQGSGFVASREGAIVTNYHVVELARNVSVEFIDGESYQEIFLIIGYPSQDIAILHIEGENKQFRPVTLGNSDDLQVGERVLAIGNPYGWENTVSDGLISGIRQIDDFKLLQITVPISPGSSGGALFNMNGEVIGITTIGSQWGAQNLNFAIPINSLKSLIKQDLSEL